MKRRAFVAAAAVAGLPASGQHQAETCRMGKDPKTSATDPRRRLHEVNNVHVADSSVLVTHGEFNPSLAIPAMAYWASADTITERKDKNI
jgi:choline dehydrogenase-like flavoprotein